MSEVVYCDDKMSNNVDNNCHKSILEIRQLIVNIDNDRLESDNIYSCLKNTLQLLESIHQCNITAEVEEIEIQPDDVIPDEVANWIKSTFSRTSNTSVDVIFSGLERFRSAANYIKTGLVLEKVMRKSVIIDECSFNTEEIREYLKKHLDSWTVDMFEFDEMAGGKCLTNVIKWVMDDFQFLDKYQIPEVVFQNFLDSLEDGYSHYSNPYHNTLHAADVVQTCSYFVNFCGLANCLTNLEIFALIFAAMIHDYKHTGTTNNFHVNTKSDLAVMYNDRSVLENYHLSQVFQIMQDPNKNILANLSTEEYQIVRNLTVEMVLNTDMNLHSHQLKFFKTKISLNENLEKGKVLSLILHCADISHPSKEWSVHFKWTMRLLDEFFLQGDKERSLNIAISPLCDRNNIHINDSQIGFLDYVVIPTFEIVECVLKKITLEEGDEQEISVSTPWKKYMGENKIKWQSRSNKKL